MIETKATQTGKIAAWSDHEDYITSYHHVDHFPHCVHDSSAVINNVSVTSREYEESWDPAGAQNGILDRL